MSVKANVLIPDIDILGSGRSAIASLNVTVMTCESPLLTAWLSEYVIEADGGTVSILNVVLVGLLEVLPPSSMTDESETVVRPSMKVVPFALLTV